MRVGDIVAFNGVGKKIYISKISSCKWKILKMNDRKTEALLVKPEDYDYFYDIVKDSLTKLSLNRIYDIIWKKVEYEVHPYAAIHINNLQLHRIESQNKDNTDKLEGVPEVFFKTPE